MHAPATAAASPGTRLITPSGSPAACSSRIVVCAETTAVLAGFQTTVLPISAGAEGRFAPIAVKLNGLTANTNPSSGRSSSRFQTPWLEIGCLLPGPARTRR